MKYGSIIIIVFVIACCAGRNVSDKPISESERLFRSKCSACHRLPDKDKFGTKKWKQVLSQHNERLKLDQRQIEAILTFVCSDSGKQVLRNSIH
jgi:hypothetical protein